MTTDFHLDTYTSNDMTHEAVGISWADAEAILGRPHNGTPEDDKSLTMALLASGAPSWCAAASGAIDEWGWYLLGPEVAEPMLDSEIEEHAGDFVVIGDECFDVSTDEQTAAVARMLARLGLPAAPVWRGQAPDTVKTTMVVSPRA